MRRAVVRWSSLVVVLSIASFSPAQSGKRAAKAPNPDEPAMHDYILTMDRVNRYAAVSQKLRAAAAGDPVMAAEMKKIEDADVYNVEKAALIDNAPHTAAWLRSSGMSAREFVLIPMTALTAGLASAAQDAKGKPPAFVNPSNIQFVRDHRSELRKLELFGSSDSKGQDSDHKSNK